jgi:hypothetical protein
MSIKIDDDEDDDDDKHHHRTWRKLSTGAWGDRIGST